MGIEMHGKDLGRSGLFLHKMKRKNRCLVENTSACRWAKHCVLFKQEALTSASDIKLGLGRMEYRRWKSLTVTLMLSNLSSSP
ncbi:hypothetical protein TNCV_1112291 [Trichonephila clavipes]|uniref:Uncharacterized protein n=1 Tax=Trichonephila clavipes TaxID=2585209 RepID=A0A8X6RGU2_TRICX|nr:hypothetical protein TNCV_1112291 [Trichonephila clavipes]